MTTTSSMESHVGQVVSLAALGRDTTGTVVSKLWSPSLGEVLRVREGHHGQPDSTLVLYGERRELVIADRRSGINASTDRPRHAAHQTPAQ